jgi:hypothetical protein
MMVVRPVFVSRSSQRRFSTARMRDSVQRHTRTSLAARYGYRTDLTFYTLHGDLFAYLCGIITLCTIPAMTLSARRPRRHVKIRIAW